MVSLFEAAVRAAGVRRSASLLAGQLAMLAFGLRDAYLCDLGCFADAAAAHHFLRDAAASLSSSSPRCSAAFNQLAVVSLHFYAKKEEEGTGEDDAMPLLLFVHRAALLGRLGRDLAFRRLTVVDVAAALPSPRVSQRANERGG